MQHPLHPGDGQPAAALQDQVMGQRRLCGSFFHRQSPSASIVCGQAGLLFRDHLVHLAGNVFRAGLHIREHPHLDGTVAEGDLDDVPGVDGLTGLGHLAVDEDAACIRHLVCHGAAFDQAGDLEILIQTHLELFLSFQQKSRRTLCRQRRRDRTDYRVSFRDLPGLNTMLREAAMVMGSRVRGLMP